MKALVFLTSIDKKDGGPSRSVPLFVRGLAEIGVDVTLMFVKSNDMNLHALEGTSAKIHILPQNYKRNELENFVAEEKFNVIHGQCIWEPIFHYMRVIADKFNIPFLLSPRGTLEPWCLQHHKWKKKLAMWLYQRKDLDRCKCIYATADLEARHIRDLGFERPLCVIPNGIKTEDYPCRSSRAIVKKQVLFLSRIHQKKGIEILINAWNMIYASHKDWNLVIAGNGDQSYIESLKKKIINLKLDMCVEIKDPVFGSAKIDLYQSSSLFVLPSYSENFGMVIAEAMSCGVPVITTNNTPWEILNETSTGWCIPLSVEEFIKNMSIAMNMPAQNLYDMGQRGSALVYDNFDYHSCAKKNKALYEWILNGGSEPEFMYK